MNRQDADSLLLQARDYFRRHAASHGLDASSLTVEYVLNWGGFVNHSYHVRDARARYHLKLATMPEYRDSLQQWRELAPLLERYRAPRIVGWIDLGQAAGLLFEHVDGTRPILTEDVLAELLPMLGVLQEDRVLAEALMGDEQPTACDVYLSTFHERFTEDLRDIREEPPPFLSESLLRRLEDEAASLASTIRSTPAFNEPLRTPVHGDLWLNNILWVAQGRWHLLDWDDVHIGDPAIDVATLLGPTAEDLTPLKHVEMAQTFLPASARERLPLLGRATLLDWVIDPVSDWIDARQAPTLADAVRPEKERVHRAALQLYAQLYR